MSHGFVAINDQSLIQIDENFINFQVYSHGAINISGYEPAVLVYPKNAIVFVKPTAYDSSIRFFVSGNIETSPTTLASYLHAVYSSGAVPEAFNPATASLEYLIVVPTNVIGDVTAGYGMNVYNGAGNLVFSSIRRTVSIQQVNTITYSSFLDSPPAISISKASNLDWLELSCLADAFNYYFDDGTDYYIVNVASSVAFVSSTSINFRKAYILGSPGFMVGGYNLTKNIILAKY